MRAHCQKRKELNVEIKIANYEKMGSFAMGNDLIKQWSLFNGSEYMCVTTLKQQWETQSRGIFRPEH